MLEDFVPLVVQIAGQEYTLRVPPSKIDQAKQLVQFVNQRMHDISQKSGTVTTSRVAVLTALAIADELFSLRERIEGTPAEPEKPAHKPTLPKPTKEIKETKEPKEVITEIKDKKESSPEIQKKVALLHSLIDEELSKS
ncbi:MAG: cell division protein ZapA [bacterium]|nr:cell division protein ZapA [bacterium]